MSHNNLFPSLPKNRQILLVLLPVFILAYIALVSLYYQKTEVYAIAEAEKDALDTLLTHKAIHRYVTEVSRPEIYRLQNEGLLYKEYFSPKVMSFTFTARSIMGLINDEREKAGQPRMYFKLATDNPRNPINQADKFESALLERMNHGEVKDIREIVNQDGQATLHLAVPIDRSSKGCLKCHGDPKDAPAELVALYGDQRGFHEDPNKIRALISIRVPLSQTIGVANELARLLAIASFAIMAAIYSLIYFFILRIDREQQAVNTGIERRKQTEEALRKTSLYARSLIEASLDPLVTISPAGKITDVNQATEAVTGKAREELIGSDFSSYFTEPEKAHAGYEKVFSDGKVTDFPLAIRHASGHVTDVLYNATTYRNAAGEIEGVFAAARDVSAQKLAETALRESETKLRAVADNTYDWEYWQAPDSHFIYMSPSCERVTGYTEQEFLTYPDLIQQILDPRDMHLYADHLHEIHTKGLCEIEFRIRTKSGETHWIAHNCRPVYDRAGNYLGRRASNRDVTAAKDAELQYRTIIQTAQDGFLIVGKDTRFIDTNDAYCRMMGYDRDEILKMKVTDVEAIEDSEEAQRHTEEMYRTGHAKFETRHRHRNRSIIDVEVTVQHMNLSGGVLVTFIRDISDRKRAERLIEVERSRLHDFSTSSADWFWEMDTDLRFSYFSDNFESKYGVSPTEILGKTRKELVAPNNLNDVSQLDAHLEQLQQHLPFREFEYRIRDSAGQIRWVSISGVTVHDPKGEFAGYRGIGRIITERKHMEEELDRHRTELEVLVEERTQELAKAKEAAEAANVAKSTFLANMSHEMRTPLHQVAGMAALMRREPLTPKQTNRMDMMDTSLRNLTGIIDTILELTRLEAKHFELAEAPFEPVSLVRKAVETVQAQADVKHLPIIVETEPVPFRLLGDAHHITMALTNYLTNAIRFTPEGCVTVRTKLVEENKDSALLRIEVEDTGIGIAPEDQARLFNIFEQVDNSSTRQYGGLGAGLAMTKKIAQLMGGDAGCGSRQGEGSLFWLTVRLKKG